MTQFVYSLESGAESIKEGGVIPTEEFLPLKLRL